MITFSHVTYNYNNENSALDDVSLHIKSGEFICILGGNGSGKSSLSKHINALLVPDTGSVLVAKLDTSNPENTYLIRSNAGMVFQNPDDQLVANLIENEIAFGPENLGLKSSEIQKRVTQSLIDVGLEGYERKETSALSGGQKQRVAIAGALAMNPDILILDEASSMLDPRGRQELMNICKSLRARGMTIIMITHFMDEAAQADRIIVLNEGKISAEGKPEEVLTHEDALANLHLEIPFATQLSHLLQKEEIPIKTHIDTNELAQELAHLLQKQDQASFQSVSKPSKAMHKDATEENACPLVKFENVSYSYDAEFSKKQEKRRPKRIKKHDKDHWGCLAESSWALKDINLSVFKGEFLGIAGHTGSGKSTLIQHMNGLINPSTGTVYIQGENIHDRKIAQQARRQIGLLFQYPEHQLFAQTVFEDIAFGPRNLGVAEKDIPKRVKLALSQVGLDFDTVQTKSPFELSGGQQRKVAFAGILAMQPQVLILDEPTAGLDPQARHEFLELIAKLHKSGQTIVMVSHNMDDLAQYSSRVVVLKEGSIVQEGRPCEIFIHEENLLEIGLGVPCAQHLANKLAARGVALRQDVLYSPESLAKSISSLLKAGSYA